MVNKKNIIGLMFVLIIGALFAGCGNDSNINDNNQDNIQIENDVNSGGNTLEETSNNEENTEVIDSVETVDETDDVEIGSLI